MKTGVDERPARAKDAGTLAHEARKIVYVSVREHRHDGIEVSVRDRKGHGVRSNQLNTVFDTIPRKTELVGGEVDARYFPPKRKQSRHVQSGPTAEVQATSRAGTQQTLQNVGRGERELSEVRVVPLS
jgi:hypothetical protein